MISLLQNYKTRQCNEKDCEVMTDLIYINYFKCKNYHNEEDIRRNPYCLSQPGQFNYYPTYLYNQNPNDKTFNPNICLNYFEYIFHPLVFRQTECTDKQIDCCANNEYISKEGCPYYHSSQEKQQYQQLTTNENIKNHFVAQYGQNVYQSYQKSIELLNQLANTNDNKLDLIEVIKTKSSKKYQEQEQDVLNNDQNSHQNQVRKKSRRDQINDNSVVFKLYSEINYFEDQNNEFKYFKRIEKQHIWMIVKYICGFLNVSGGSIYIGITDSGIVKGIHMPRRKIDEFQLQIDYNLKKFQPIVFAEECQIIFHNVYSDDYQILPDLYIIQIKVQRDNYNEVYMTGQQECYIKQKASIKQLDKIEFKKYIEKLYKKQQLNE